MKKKLSYNKYSKKKEKVEFTQFEKEVYYIVSKIPLGQVRTYKWVAEQLGNPKAVRAVANALAKNCYPFFIPCHRVIRSDGSLGGYSLGKDLKKELLCYEQKVAEIAFPKNKKSIIKKVMGKQKKKD